MKSEWALLTAGTLDKFNTMTIGWLTAGIIWGKDVITCYVRPSRYTYEFIKTMIYSPLAFTIHSIVISCLI